MGASLAAYFGVFHRLLAARLREAASTPDEARLAWLSTELAEGAAASQHAYVHTQLLLRAAAAPRAGAGGGGGGAAGAPAAAPRFLRLAQELESAAAAAHGGVVWKMGAWLAGARGGPAAQQAAGVVADLLAGAGASGTPPTSELIRLHRLYFPQQQQQQHQQHQQHQQQHQQQQQALAAMAVGGPTAGGGAGSGDAASGAAEIPPVAVLQRPRVFEVLLSGLFSPTRQLPPDAYAACSALLALAAAAADERGEPPPGQQWPVQEEEQQQESRDAGDEQQQEQERQQWGGEVERADLGGRKEGELDLAEVMATREALAAAADLGRRSLAEHRSTPHDLALAAEVFEYPCCAAGECVADRGGRSRLARLAAAPRAPPTASQCRALPLPKTGTSTSHSCPFCPSCPHHLGSRCAAHAGSAAERARLLAVVLPPGQIPAVPWPAGPPRARRAAAARPPAGRAVGRAARAGQRRPRPGQGAAGRCGGAGRCRPRGSCPALG